jgi:hypothetical protein
VALLAWTSCSLIALRVMQLDLSVLPAAAASLSIIVGQ